MSRKYLLDTHIIIGALKEHAKIQIFFHFNLLGHTRFISEMTRMELLTYPQITSDEETAIHTFLAFVEVLPINNVIASRVIQLRRHHKSLKIPDAIVAATAIEYHLTLVSCNPCFNDSIVGLNVLNPNNL